MNVPTRPVEAKGAEARASRPSAAEAAAAVRTLLRWTGLAREATGGELESLLAAASEAGLPVLSRRYPEDFAPEPDYLATLPDLQNGPESLIRGARTPIQQVGIAGFRLPVRYPTREGGELALETAVTGAVSVEAGRKGINMSRIMRAFYRHAEASGGFELIERVLDSYRSELDSPVGRLLLRFNYPIRRRALRSGLEGFQYYATALEGLRAAAGTLRIVHLDYVYSSTCPCSLELAEHARRTRGQLATPHAQRSVARVSVALAENAAPLVEDLVDLFAAAIPTETQVMVKREDEQAFAELNAANPVFVEDAVRLLADALAGDARIADFRVVASHQESLHSHDAVSILSRGPTFAQTSWDPRLFDTLRHAG